ncbi:hypothetical protein BG005_001253, partial [Podila minutissima]
MGSGAMEDHDISGDQDTDGNDQVEARTTGSHHPWVSLAEHTTYHLMIRPIPEEMITQATSQPSVLDEKLLDQDMEVDLDHSLTTSHTQAIYHGYEHDTAHNSSTHDMAGNSTGWNVVQDTGHSSSNEEMVKSMSGNLVEAETDEDENTVLNHKKLYQMVIDLKIVFCLIQG